MKTSEHLTKPTKTPYELRWKLGGPTLVKEQQHLTVADRDILRTASFSTHNMSGEEAIRLCSQWHNKYCVPLG